MEKENNSLKAFLILEEVSHKLSTIDLTLAREIESALDYIWNDLSEEERLQLDPLDNGLFFSDDA